MSATPLSCDITVMATGPAMGRHLTLMIVSDYDERFVEGLKRLPARDRGWEDPPGRWWVAPKHRQTVCALAAKYYPLASLHEGAKVTNLRTGVAKPAQDRCRVRHESWGATRQVRQIANDGPCCIDGSGDLGAVSRRVGRKKRLYVTGPDRVYCWSHALESFERAISIVAPTSDPCRTKIVGHGVEAQGAVFGGAHGASHTGVRGARDRT
jgi:hypothetical protein